MTNGSSRLWPYGTRYALGTTFVAFVAFFALILIAHLAFGFPEKLESGIVWALLLVSLVPVGLVLLDGLVGRGASIEYMGVKLALAGTLGNAPAAFAIPTNIEEPSQQIGGSNTKVILRALNDAASRDVAIINLGDGKAWWVTKLLLVIAGAARRGRPSAIVFIATMGGVSGRFQGWGKPRELLPTLLRDKDIYARCYSQAAAAAAQWALVEPSATQGWPIQPQWLGDLAKQYFYQAFDEKSGLPDPLAFERMLDNLLSQQTEAPAGSDSVSVTRLRELFDSVLHREKLDEFSPEDEQVARLLNGPGDYVAVTRAHVFLRLLSKEAGLAALVQSLVKQRQTSAP